jgi:epoxyqueuosine reductase QueG
LRVILTNADITDHLPPCESVCIHCGACRNACPANAIQNNELLGNECSIHQKEIADTIDAYSYKCEICARACPIGIAPKIIHIQ